MTSQGQRFRRRALRRGYKVDEVDAFLDRVESTLSGEQSGAPVAAQDVHDVVFRVRFGGYDEWQVDLHLDRVERQLTELEERGGSYRVEQRLAPQQLPERALPPGPSSSGFGPPQASPPLMPTPQTSSGFAPRPADDRPDFDDRQPPPQQQPPQPPPVREDRGFAPPVEDFPTQGFPAVRGDRSTGPQPVVVPAGPPPGLRPEPQVYERPEPPQQPAYAAGFDPGRHGRSDMTGEIRVVDSAYTSDEVARVDALRRTFQPRRFGSGYDVAQVDRLFDAVMSVMTGRSSVSITDGELDQSQFSLVQGGYFEADVDSALKEIRELLRRR